MTPPTAVTEDGEAKVETTVGALEDGAELDQVEPFEVRTFPLEPGAIRLTDEVPLPDRRYPAVRVARPVPPVFTPIAVPVLSALTGIFESVLLAPEIVLLVRVSVLVSVANVVPVLGTERALPPVEF